MSLLNTGIYIITNIKNNKCYIGSAVNIQGRWKVHLSTLENKKHDNGHLQASYNKYGKESFIFDILCYCKKEDLLYFEQKCIDLFKPEYNILKIAGSTLGYKHTEATKAKMSKPRSEETKRKISEAKKGKTFSEEAKANMSKAKIGNTNSLGFKHTEETRAKMSKSQTGVRITEETKQKISEANKLAHARPDNKYYKKQAA